MSRERICAWLKIAPTPWPPDPYALLGLAAGETDPERIELHAQLRIERVRCYQLAHPEAATEAMQLLAQAFDRLRDASKRKTAEKATGAAPAGKPAPTAASRSKAPSPVVLREPPRAAAQPASAEVAAVAAPPTEAPPVPAAPIPLDTADPLGWMNGPWNAPGPPKSPGAETVDSPLNKVTQEMPAVEPTASPSEPAAPPEPPRQAVDEAMDAAIEAARSAPARRGLGTKGAVYSRISRTRKLLRAWAQAGNYLGDWRVRLNRRGEAIDLVRQLTVIRQQLQDFPPLLGQAGQPGYLVVVLSRQQEIVKTFQAMQQTRREMLVRDWESGLSLLAAYRLFLREEIRVLRRQSRSARLKRAARALLAETGFVWLIVLAAIALNLAVVPLRAWRLVQFVTGGLLLASMVTIPRLLRQNALRRSRRRPPSAG